MPLSCGHFCTASHGSSFQRWWRAGRGRGTEREPLSVMRCKFPPRACISARSFLLEGRSGSSLSSRTELPASRSRNSQIPVSPCGDHANPFRVARAGRRIYAGFGPTGVFQSLSRVSTCFPFISKGEFVFLIRREQYHRLTGFRPAVVDPTCCSFGGHASPEDARMGRRIDEFRLVLVSVPVARSDHCSYRCGYTTFVLPS